MATTKKSTVLSFLDDLINTSALLPYKGDWLPTEHTERLQQYELFRALEQNRFGALIKDRAASKKFRGYGDYGLIVETSRDAVLGDRVGIEVPGASDDEDPGAQARQDLLDAWAERERWASKIFRAEHDAAAVGDCVYELRPDGDRLRLRAHDPECFFPVWENAEGDFSEAYLAWEETNTGQYLPEPPENLKDLVDRDGEVVLYRRHYRVVTTEEAREIGAIVLDGAEREGVCIVTAGWYRIETKKGEDAPGFLRLALIALETDDDGASIEDADTGFDEVPLFYVPNREATGQPWGLPEGDKVLQVLLDAGQDQTDLKENTFLNAFPPLYDEMDRSAAPARPGAASVPAEQKYKAGQIYNNRKLGVVDLSNGNKLLLEHEAFLIDKALRNSRTTAVAAGVAPDGSYPSGYALMISLLPLFAKTLPKRITRRDKLGMLLKHVLRWHRDWAEPGDFFGEPDPRSAGDEAAEQTGRDAKGWPAGIWDDLTAYPSFGSIVPVDKQQLSQIVQQLMTSDSISTETAVLMLQMGGFPIDDAAEEVARIKEQMAPPVGAPGSGFGNEGFPIPGLGGDEEEDDEEEGDEE